MIGRVCIVVVITVSSHLHLALCIHVRMIFVSGTSLCVLEILRSQLIVDASSSMEKMNAKMPMVLVMRMLVQHEKRSQQLAWSSCFFVRCLCMFFEACNMSDFTVFQIEMTKGYDMNAFREAGGSDRGR